MRSVASRSAALVRGFTLLELLVALSIMAMGIALIYRIAGGNLRTTSDLALRQQALALADALLTENAVLAPGPLAQSGAMGDIQWSVESSPQAVGLDEPGRPRLRELAVRLSWPTAREPAQLALQVWVPEIKPAGQP